MNKKNAEGYQDPTAYEAMTRILKKDGIRGYRPIVYICSPYSGNIELNTKKARMYCRCAIDRGCIPIAPHLFFPQFMNDTNSRERELAIYMNTILMKKCAEVWVCGNYISKGMLTEIGYAQKKRLPIKYLIIEEVE